MEEAPETGDYVMKPAGVRRIWWVEQRHFNATGRISS
jgi:hypothetical protein